MRRLLAVVALAVGCAKSDAPAPTAPSGTNLGSVKAPVTGAHVGGPLAKGAKPAAGELAVQCKGGAQAVSPTIFGVAFADVEKDMGATAHRWGGNQATRYNPKLGNASNGINTWFYENVEFDSWETFVAKAAERGGRASITVPIMGWVAKDTTSCPFTLKEFPQQQQTSPDKPQCGNGKTRDGKDIPAPKDPSRWATRITPEDVGAWVAKIKAADQKRGRKVVYQYILDNEPALWDSTHRDVHPEPTTYDELLEKTIAFGTAVRKADPEALIAGPAEWGWPGYFYSGKDAKAGFGVKPDRKAHGDEPLLAWYLKKLAEHEKKTGVKILDVLALHIYPQGEGVQTTDGKGGAGAGKTDRATNELRFRATRSLWDREYKDESWIGEQEDGAVYLIPRMKELIAQSYPGLGFMIGEYNFGAEDHIAGGVAQAEALGRFALHGLDHAFFWNAPKKGTPAYWAFRAYRNYDGAGGHFLDQIVPTSSPRGTSLYASKDASGKRWVLVALNFSSDTPFDASIALTDCAPPSAVKSFSYAGGPKGLVPSDAKLEGGHVKLKLPPTSIHVITLTLP